MVLNVLIVLSFAFVLIFKSKRYLHMLQQNLYNENNRYVKWVFKNYKQFMDWDIILILIAFAGSLVFYDLEVVSVIGMIGLIIVGYFN